MRKIISVVVLLVVCVVLSSTAVAEERIVQLTLSGCADCGAAARIEAILKKTKGVLQHENKGHGLIVVTYNDEITTLNIISNQLKRGKLFVEGEAIFLK